MEKLSGITEVKFYYLNNGDFDIVASLWQKRGD